MKYFNGTKVKLGDRVELSGNQGIVVAIISEEQYMEGYDKLDWEYLKKGALVKFDKYGLIYYEDDIEGDVSLFSRLK